MSWMWISFHKTSGVHLSKSSLETFVEAISKLLQMIEYSVEMNHSLPHPLKDVPSSFYPSVFYFVALIRARINPFQILNQAHGELLASCFNTISPREQQQAALCDQDASVIALKFWVFVYIKVRTIILSTQGRGHPWPPLPPQNTSSRYSTLITGDPNCFCCWKDLRSICC